MKTMNSKKTISLIASLVGLSLFIPWQRLQAQNKAPSLSPNSTNSTDLPSRATETAYSQYMRLGYTAFQKGEAETATLYFRNALYERPNDRAATIAYWNARNAMKRQAKQEITQASSDYDRYMMAGYDATDLRDYPAALDNFKRALAERPEDFYATQALRNVQIYIARGQGQPGLSDPLSPSVIYPLESPYNRYLRLGYLAQQQGNYQAAANYFRSALTENPRDRYATLAYWNAMNALSGSNSTDITTDTTATESDYDRYMRIGYDATERGNYQAALINFQRALQERPNDYYAIQAVRNVQTYIVDNQ
ncbi:MAG: tetratricopeptide repeat protein [Snowella sp.]|nr:tetratricopeptide repeat protein [Snowella sp.]